MTRIAVIIICALLSRWGFRPNNSREPRCSWSSFWDQMAGSHSDPVPSSLLFFPPQATWSSLSLPPNPLTGTFHLATNQSINHLRLSKLEQFISNHTTTPQHNYAPSEGTRAIYLSSDHLVHPAIHAKGNWACHGALCGTNHCCVLLKQATIALIYKERKRKVVCVCPVALGMNIGDFCLSMEDLLAALLLACFNYHV